jgi:hypothetical protein
MGKRQMPSSPEIISISNANGWCAVYMSRGDRSLFTVPLVSWALAKKWDSCNWVKDDKNTIIGMVLSIDGHSVVPAAEAELVKQGEDIGKDPACFCGYLPPGENLRDDDWAPVWDAS